MALKQIKLPKRHDHFPLSLDIRGNSWTRRIITGVYHQAKYEEEKVNAYGLYKAIIVKKEYPAKPGMVAGTVYGVYIYPVYSKKQGTGAKKGRK